MLPAPTIAYSNITQSEVAPTPTIQITAANSSVDLTGNFTLAMVDADIVGADESNITRHWLENSVVISSASLNTEFHLLPYLYGMKQTARFPTHLPLLSLLTPAQLLPPEVVPIGTN